MEAAPFFDAKADAPVGTRAIWVRAADGVRIRLMHAPCEGATGTVLLMPGRTEFVEKYGRTARDLVDRGFEVLAIDWRGQGLADRLLDDTRIGHVGQFWDYQLDVDTMVATAREMGVPEPFHMLAHSMGGCIGLRALTRGIGVQSAAFSAPMWGIQISSVMRPVAWTLSWSGTKAGLGHRLIPGSTAEALVLTDPFEDNPLTSDPEMYDYMRAQTAADSGLHLGGPSLQWLSEALAECLALSNIASPQLPCLTFLGSDERIVDPQRIRDRMGRWPDGRLEMIPGARHEVLMETPATRARIADDIAAHFRGESADYASIA